MPTRRPYHASAKSTAHPGGWLGGWGTRVVPPLLALMAIALIVVGKVDNSLVEQVRRPVTDVVTPLLVVLAQPVDTVQAGIAAAQSWIAVREENARLRAENERLRGWYQTAQILATENAGLRSLVNAPAPPGLERVSTRVIGSGGGVFVRSLLLPMGTRHGVSAGHAVVATGGLVGRIVEPGRLASRVLLITDLNARVPVMLEQSGHRAIMRGDNTSLPVLDYLARDARPERGERVLTSGLDGVLPPGIPVGVVHSTVGKGNDNPRVAPAVDLERVAAVQVLLTEPSNPLFRRADGGE